ncbi:hypothetical protein ABPG75_014020 [Micractinium tetrahymenae]
MPSRRLSLGFRGEAASSPLVCWLQPSCMLAGGLLTVVSGLPMFLDGIQTSPTHRRLVRTALVSKTSLPPASCWPLSRAGAHAPHARLPAFLLLLPSCLLRCVHSFCQTKL